MTLDPSEFSGVIARIEHPDTKQLLQSLGLPVVNIGRDLGQAAFPRVASDDVAVGRLAAEHLLERNFWQFGFLCSSGRRNAIDRQKGFLERLGGLADRVAALGGRLRVTSPRGDGTTVAAELPLAQSANSG